MAVTSHLEDLRIRSEREQRRKKPEWTPNKFELRAILDKHHQWHMEASRVNSLGVGGFNAFPGRADLESADLRGAEALFQGYQLRSANLDFANLEGVTLRNAKLSNASLNYVAAAHANCTKANLVGASLIKADLCGADFNGADLGGALLHGSILKEANLSDANLRNATGFLLDDCYIKGARFSTRSRDPWSTVRRHYTGPMFVFHLLFLIAFLAAYTGRAAFWMGVNTAQEAFARAQVRLIGKDARDPN